MASLVLEYLEKCNLTKLDQKSRWVQQFYNQCRKFFKRSDFNMQRQFKNIFSRSVRRMERLFGWVSGPNQLFQPPFLHSLGSFQKVLYFLFFESGYLIIYDRIRFRDILQFITFDYNGIRVLPLYIYRRGIWLIN